MTPPPDHSAAPTACPTRSRRSSAWPTTSPGPGTSEIAAVLARGRPRGARAAAGNPVGDARCRRARRGSRRSPPTTASATAWRAPTRASNAHLSGAELVRDAAGRARRDRLLLARVRAQRGAAAVLGRPRHPRRRPPQGRQRPRRADRRHRALLPQRLLPPAADGARRAARRSSSSSTPTLLPLSPVRARRRRARADRDRRSRTRTLHAALWRVDVGRVPLLLLDTDVPENAPAERAVTDRLYGGDSEHRLRQEILLGIGGVKALAACGIEPAVFHMNEGHAGFLRARARARPRRGRAARAASTRCQVVRARTVFTTHTPVPAGIDRFSHDLMARYFGHGGVPTGLPLERLLALGAETGGDPRVFNMAALGIRMAARVNGVSRAARRRSRARCSRRSGPASPSDDVPITHVTNGVHAETWVGPEFAALYRARLGDGYGARCGRLGAARRRCPTPSCSRRARDARLRLVDEVRRRLAAQARERGDAPSRACVARRRCSIRRRSRSASRGACRPTSA